MKIFLIMLMAFGVMAEPVAQENPATSDLLQIFEIALQNDPTYKEARERRNATLETRPQAIARLLPLLSVTAGSSWNYLNNKKASTFQGGGVQRYWDSQVGVNLNQPVFNFELWVQLSQANNQIAQAEAEYANALQDLMQRTIKVYLDVLLAKDTLQFAISEKAALARQLEQAQQRFNVGLIAITDVLEAQSGYDRARSREIFAANGVDNAKEALREIIGEFEGKLILLPTTIPLMKPEPLDINEWAATADQQNLGVISAQNQAEVARKNIELQRSGHYPTLDLVASYSFQDNNSSFGLRGETGQIGLNLNIPVFEGGAVNSRTRAAHYDFNAEKDKLQAIRRAIRRQVKDAYRGVLSTISQVEALRATVKSSISALEATEAGFEVGTRTMVDVVNEQRNLFDAQRNLSEARNNYLLNWVSLKESASSLSQKDLETLNGLLGI